MPPADLGSKPSLCLHKLTVGSLISNFFAIIFLRTLLIYTICLTIQSLDFDMFQGLYLNIGLTFMIKGLGLGSKLLAILSDSIFNYF